MHLREQILSGRLKPGEKINQEAIAELLGISKLPVREGLIALEGEGLIDNVPRRGAYVAALTRQDVLDHYTAYGLICGLVASRAAATLTDEDLVRLGQIQTEMERGPDAETFGALNFRFHEVINRAGSSRRLRSLVSLMAKSIPEHFFEITPAWPDKAIIDHREILTALQQHDGDRASAAMVEHLRSSGQFAVSALDEANFWAE